MTTPGSTSLDTLAAEARAYLRTRNPGRAVGPRSFLGVIASARALQLLGLHRAVEDAYRDAVPTRATSTERLDEWAQLLGIDNGAGDYGRRGATAAQGGAATLTGTKATAYLANATATAEDGTTQIKLVAGVTIPGVAPGVGSVAATFVAVTTGTAGNLPAGSVCTWDSPPAGADEEFTLTTGLAGGLDVESNDALLARIEERLQLPPKGGAAGDYSLWAEDPDSGAVVELDAYVYPLRSMIGSVDVVTTVRGASGTARDPGATVAATIQTWLDGLRPVGVAVTSLQPTMTGFPVIVRIVPSATRYAFDYDGAADGGVIGTVDGGGYAVGPPATITLTGLAPAEFKAAVTAYIGGTREAPRIQVAITSGPVVPVQVRVVSWSDGGGQTTLTLENPLPDGFPGTSNPVGGDIVYNGGPIATQCAQAILDYIDSLGPSRQSGWADPTAQWLDTLHHSQVARVVLNVTDTDGTRVAQSIVVLGGGNPGDLSISLAGGLPDTTPSVVAADSTPGSPELLYAMSIVVTD